MSLTDNNNGMVMPVSPMYGGGNMGAGFGSYGDGLFWIIILFLFAAMSGNGWGNNAGNGYNGILPFMLSQNTNNDVQRVVDQQSLMTGISALSAAQANGFANAEISRCNMLSGLTGQLNTIAMTQQNCCCENRQAVADLKYTMAQEAAATRANTDAKTQAIMDKLCQLEMDGMRQNYENRIATMQNTIDSLRTANSNARFDASQNAQTAAIEAGQRTLANEIEQYVAPSARPAYIVQNPNCGGPQTFGCGCSAVA